MGLLGRRNVEQERSRDITVALRAAGGPIDEVEGAINQIVADKYGKRNIRQHEDIIMANEYIAMIKHIDDTIAMLQERLTATIEEAETLKAVLHGRVGTLTKRVEHELTIITAYKTEFTGIHQRVTEAIDDKSNSNTNDDNMSGNGWGSKKPQENKSASSGKNNSENSNN